MDESKEEQTRYGVRVAAALGRADAAMYTDRRGPFATAARVLAADLRFRKLERDALQDLTEQTRALISDLQKTGRLSRDFNLSGLDAALHVLKSNPPYPRCRDGRP